MPPRPDSMPPPPLGAGGAAAARAQSQISRHGERTRCVTTLKSVSLYCKARQASSRTGGQIAGAATAHRCCATQGQQSVRPKESAVGRQLLLRRSTGRCASGRAQWCCAGGGAAEWRGGGDGAARGMARGAGRADAPAHERTRVRTSRMLVTESSGAPGNQALHKHPRIQQLRAGTGPCGIWWLYRAYAGANPGQGARPPRLRGILIDLEVAVSYDGPCRWEDGFEMKAIGHAIYAGASPQLSKASGGPACPGDVRLLLVLGGSREV